MPSGSDWADGDTRTLDALDPTHGASLMDFVHQVVIAREEYGICWWFGWMDLE